MLNRLDSTFTAATFHLHTSDFWFEYLVLTESSYHDFILSEQQQQTKPLYNFQIGHHRNQVTHKRRIPDINLKHIQEY